MDLQSEKKNIADTLQELTEKEYVKKRSRIYQGMRSLQRDMEGDFYTVVVLGEFKRGKSTLVNALLGNGLLPMNVLPETATINAIMYAEEPRLSVMYRDGT
ncbi:MAG: dynamin family protein, partial [Lachnospiraceae bacterium]|nr:dynamin family protein [Lachnospiraceae bacterium]